MEDAFGDAAHQFGLGGAQGGLGYVLVARGNCLFDLAQVGTDARTARFVDGKTAFVLTSAFLGLGRICQVIRPLSGLRCLNSASQTHRPAS